GLGVDVLVSLLVARGRRDGPVFGLTAAVHGNELNGIRVIHDFFETLDVNALRGTVVGVACVNVPGLHSNQRELHGEFDLNRVFPGRLDGNSAQVYASRILDRVVSRFDRLVDLHTASFGRINSLYVRADLSDATTRHMALLQRPQIIVHNPPRDQSLRGAAMGLGIPAITVEVGDPQRYQLKLIRSTRNGIRDLLADAGMIPRKKRVNPPEPILCRESSWIFTDRGGLLEVLPMPADRIEQGALVARVKDAFGDVIREYFAPAAGVVIGKSTNPVAPTGARILHLGVEVEADHPLRRQAAVALGT
ncbi:MAG: succinylglutamate desuccinylase/aspartoacylase family protein, partial [Nannocystaceae bacterium]